MTAWWSSASLTFRHRLRKVAVLMQYVSGVMFRYGTPVVTTGIKSEGLPQAIYTVLPEPKHKSMRKHVSQGQQRRPFVFDVRLNQIPEEWHQVAVRFRRANVIRDGDRERRFWQLRRGDKARSRAAEY